jgi:mannose-1-phosphate guanylyltransferase
MTLSFEMSNRECTWVILLTEGGGGEFDMPLDRHTLLKMTLSRALSMVPREQIVAVVERAQYRCWNGTLALLPNDNVIVHPCHRGSAVKVLLAVLAILERDPWARIIAMPSHHYVGNETALANSLLDATTPTAQTRNKLALIGIKPEAADTETGYIVPGRWFEDGTRSVQRIVKPSSNMAARELVGRGALWDSSIVAARALVLMGVLRACMPDLVDQMETVLARSDRGDVRPRALSQLYSRLPSVELSHVMAQVAEAECRVITSRSCGWSNLASARRTIGAGRLSVGAIAATV